MDRGDLTGVESEFARAKVSDLAEYFRVPVLDVASQGGVAFFDALGVVTLRFESLLLYLALQLTEHLISGFFDLKQCLPEMLRPCGVLRPERRPIDRSISGQLFIQRMN